MEETIEDLRQQLFKLQTEIEIAKWFNAKDDFKFLSEIKDRLIKGEKDVTQKEMALNMIEDWLEELKEVLEDD